MTSFSLYDNSNAEIIATNPNYNAVVVISVVLSAKHPSQTKMYVPRATILALD